jgi:hypothetical protein
MNYIVLLYELYPTNTELSWIFQAFYSVELKYQYPLENDK